MVGLRGSFRAVVATAVVASSAVMIALPTRASATLPGAPFNGADASPTSDLAAGVVAIPDGVGNQDPSNYTGSTEDDLCPAVQAGTASPKDDLDVFYFGNQTNGSGAFMYVAWHRVATTGTTTIDFEVNHASGVKANCNGINPPRTAGDLLITYDFQGSGPYTLDIERRVWIGTSTAGVWGPPAALAPGSFEASINNDGSFGELVVNLTASGLLGTNGCESFTTVFPKSRSSSANFNNAIKEFVPPRQATVSNCGSIPIHKQDDAGTALSGVVFDLYTDVANAPGVAVVPAQSCTTDASGDCTIADVFPGVYWVVERAAPIGHTGAAAQKVTVALAGNTPSGTRTFVNNRKPARIDIQKNDDAGAALAGATFSLYTDDDNALGTAVTGKSCTTNSSGQCSITGILPPGWYWVVETTTPTGHTTAASERVELSLDEVLPLTIVDNRKPAKVNIVKKDNLDAALAGATFTLYTDVADAPGTAVVGKSCTTGTAGTCSITDILPPGDYWVVETTTPAGHATAAAQAVDLDLDETVTLDFVNVRQPIGISLVKTVNGALHPANDPLFTESGTEVTYVVTIKNTGELPLTITALTDSLHAGVVDDCEQGIGSTLAAGATFTCTYTDSPTEDTENEAAVTGTDVLGRTTSADDEAFVVPLHPAIRIDKSGPAAAHVGDVVTYTFVVTNPGDTGLTDVTVTDPKCADDPELTSKAGGNDDDTLDPGESWTLTCTYTVLEADGTSVTNEVGVAGTDKLGTTVTWDDDHVFPVLHPAITIDKTATPSSVAVSATVTFSYLVTNTGDTTLFDVSVDDDKLGHIGDIASLAPGQSQTLTTTMTVAAGSPTVNVGTAVGTDRLGRTVTASDSATITLVLGVTLTRVPELPRTGFSTEAWLQMSALLLAAGFSLVVTARRRRSHPAPSA